MSHVVDRSAVVLLSNATATGSAAHWPGGKGNFKVLGTFDGETVTLQQLGPDDSTYIDAGPDTTLTAAGNGNFELPEGTIRATVSTGGGSPTGLYASAYPI